MLCINAGTESLRELEPLQKRMGSNMMGVLWARVRQRARTRGAQIHKQASSPGSTFGLKPKAKRNGNALATQFARGLANSSSTDIGRDMCVADCRQTTSRFVAAARDAHTFRQRMSCPSTPRDAKPHPPPHMAEVRQGRRLSAQGLDQKP
jgi:hypothetical protein